MKKRIVYLFSCLALAAGIFASCSDDETSISPVSVTIESVNTGKLEILPGESIELKADVQGYSDGSYGWTADGRQGISYNWTLNGEPVSTAPTYTFSATELGSYKIGLTVSTLLQGSASTTADVTVYGKYKHGTFILNEGAQYLGDKGGTFIFIDPQGNLTDMAFQKENNGSWLGSVVQDLFIHNGKMYIISQNGGNEGGFLTILHAETLKIEAAYEEEIDAADNTWPTHVAVTADDEVYFRGGADISLLNPQTKEITFVEGSDGASKTTMAVVDNKVFAAQNENLVVIEGGESRVANSIAFDSNISGVLRSSDNNLWISLSSGKIAKVSAKDYSTIEMHDIAATNADAAGTLYAGWAAASYITAKGDTLYMNGSSTKIYRHVFSTGETKLMVDVKDMVEDANIVYNTVAVNPETGLVYFNTLKNYSAVGKDNQITAFDFSGNEPKIYRAWNDYTRFPAGVFFTANFLK